MRENVPQRQMLPSRPLRSAPGVGVGMLLEQRDARHDEARRAEAAHQRVLVAERLLHRMQRVAVREAVDGANLLALHLDRQRRAGVDRAAVDDHRAGAAGAAVAAALVAGQVGAHAERIEQRDARLDPGVESLAVDHQRDRHLARADRARGARLRFGLAERDHARRGADDANCFQEVASTGVEIIFWSHQVPPNVRV